MNAKIRKPAWNKLLVGQSYLAWLKQRRKRHFKLQKQIQIQIFVELYLSIQIHKQIQRQIQRQMQRQIQWQIQRQIRIQIFFSLVAESNQEGGQGPPVVRQGSLLGNNTYSQIFWAIPSVFIQIFSGQRTFYICIFSGQWYFSSFQYYLGNNIYRFWFTYLAWQQYWFLFTFLGNNIYSNSHILQQVSYIAINISAKCWKNITARNWGAIRYQAGKAMRVIIFTRNFQMSTLPFTICENSVPWDTGRGQGITIKKNICKNIGISEYDILNTFRKAGGPSVVRQERPLGGRGAGRNTLLCITKQPSSSLLLHLFQ